MATYRELIGRSKDEKDAAQREIDVQLAAVQVDRDLISATQALANANACLVASQSAVPFYPQDVLEAQEMVVNANGDIQALKALKAEMFPAQVN
jgi:hypothetical protein